MSVLTARFEGATAAERRYIAAIAALGEGPRRVICDDLTRPSGILARALD